MGYIFDIDCNDKGDFEHRDRIGRIGPGFFGAEHYASCGYRYVMRSPPR
jgi:hypothetical protein